MRNRQPKPLYVPAFLDDEGNVVYRAGAFMDQRQAEKVLEMWREGRQEE